MAFRILFKQIIQSRLTSQSNTLQFFQIPLGNFLSEATFSLAKTLFFSK